jgi:aryl-alcohol dehydrogenase-like predicted oxidoreductase
MHARPLGKSGLTVAEIGMGCMGMSEFYGPTDDVTSRATLRRAYELGVTLFDTADMYGFGHNETLLNAFLQSHPDVKIATKFGVVRERGSLERRIDNSPAYIAQACDASLKRLGVEVIDLYYAHRVDSGQPLEETVGAMGALVKTGKVRAIGLCEVSDATLRRAHAIHPIAAVQSEYSLWTRDPEATVLPTCRKLGISFVAYAPLGRGMLTGAISRETQLAKDDARRRSPRFQKENLSTNLALVETLKALARDKHCTPGQLAVAWLLNQGGDIIPIPGSRRIEHLEENVRAAELALSSADLATIDAALPPGAAAGERYPKAAMELLNA